MQEGIVYVVKIMYRIGEALSSYRRHQQGSLQTHRNTRILKPRASSSPAVWPPCGYVGSWYMPPLFVCARGLIVSRCCAISGTEWFRTLQSPVRRT